jgi:hypothetical protein
MLADPFWFCKITTNPHTHSHTNIECPEVRCPKLKMYISKLILDSYENTPVSYVIMHCIIWPWLLIIVHFVCTGCFLIIFFWRSYEITYRQSNKFLDYFLTKHYSFIYKYVSFKVAITGMYPRITWELVEDPFGSADHTAGTLALPVSSKYITKLWAELIQLTMIFSFGLCHFRLPL